ncbi:hypothetical protein [Cytobacillus sp.]|uniref:hypothetical protein n=1 Tax=Cytobacillus sp. TaxID=2675269 RepID=UPI0035196045
MGKTIKISKDGKELIVTEKAFNVVYQGLGFKPVSDEKAKRTTKKAVQDES